MADMTSRCDCTRDIYIFLTIIIQIVHDDKVTLGSYWLTPEQFFMPFYTNKMKHDTFLHIIRFLHFSDNIN